MHSNIIYLDCQYLHAHLNFTVEASDSLILILPLPSPLSFGRHISAQAPESGYIWKRPLLWSEFCYQLPEWPWATHGCPLASVNPCKIWNSPTAWLRRVLVVLKSSNSYRVKQKWRLRSFSRNSCTFIWVPNGPRSTVLRAKNWKQSVHQQLTDTYVN